MYTTTRKLSILFVILSLFLSTITNAQQRTMATRVIDADTIQALYGGVEKRIRLLGIDTPGSRANRKAKKDENMSEQDLKTIVEMGKKAKAYVNGLVKRGDLITIEFDVQKWDKYGRLLGYVYLSNGKMLNEEIVKAGYADVMTIPPNVKYKDIFSRAYKQAKEDKRGDLIARLDQKDERAEAAQAQADFDIAMAGLKQAQSTFERRNQLFQDNLISEEEQGQITLDLAVAKGKVIQASTTLERTQERLSEAVVRAPIDGTILQKYVEEGQIIASGVSNVSGGTPIVDIADMSSVYIETGIDEIDIGKVQIGQFATVIAEAYPELAFNGEIVRIAPEAKIEQNVTLFDVVVEVKNNDGKLKSGMNTRVEIEIVKKENVLLAPVITMQIPDAKDLGDFQNRDANVRSVLLKQEGKFILQIVETGLSNFKQVIILAGVEEGSTLGVPMTSRLKNENDRLEARIRSSRSFGSKKRSPSSK